MFRAYGSDADMQIFSRCGCGEVAITGTCEPFSCGQQAAAHAQQRQKAQLQTDVARAEANFNEGAQGPQTCWKPQALSSVLFHSTARLKCDIPSKAWQKMSCKDLSNQKQAL